MDKVNGTKLHHENAAWLLITVQNGSNDVQLWTSLETNFITKTCTLEANTSLSEWLNLLQGFINFYKKLSFLE